jgi:class 3 adenylate cyclase/tetratricopeptide (TPR) repeat protein
VAATENVTVLFTDLVSSTELASALSVGAGDELRRTHFSTLRHAIAASGGIEVKTLGDGVMVVFPIASAALQCAVSMQQAVDWRNTTAERPLGLRVGLSAGEVTRESDDYFGDPVIEAARLCAHASAGQILVAELVRAVAGRRSSHTFVPVGALELKGLSDPVATLEVAWEPVRDVDGVARTIPLPSRVEIGPVTGVIGRDAEASLLTDAFKRVAAREGREIVLVSGEAGIGKTTLATQVARDAFEAGAVVLLGRCDEDLGVPYGPFAEALSHYVTYASEAMLQSHVQSLGAELAKIVPTLRQRVAELPAPQSADPDTERYLLYNAVVGLLGEMSEEAPIVLVLDDLQWADQPSLQLLRRVVANTASLPLLIIGTYRRSELSNRHPLTETLAELRRETAVSRIELAGLDGTEVLAFMEAAAGHALDHDGVGLAHALYRETDGNPFFVGEMLRHLSETGAIFQDESGRWSAAADFETMAMPDSVRMVIGARVSRLGETVSQVLPLAAVIGREFDLDLLARVTERSEDEVIDVLDAGKEAALVREVGSSPGRYCFSHALIQHTLCQDLGATRLARAHRQVAESIEAIVGNRPGQRVGELAYHWFSATQPVNTVKAISYARQAGEAALAALAPDDAVRYFSQALQLAGEEDGGDPLLECDLRLGLGMAQRQAGVPAFRETFLEAAERARQLGATDRLVRAALANNRGWFSASGVIDTGKVTVLEAALSALTDDDSPERALTLATLCSELSFGPLERRRSLANNAKAMARRLNHPATLIRVLCLLNNPLQIPSTLDERMADSGEAIALAEVLGDPEVLYHACSQSQINAIQGGEFDLAERCLDNMRALSGRLRQPTLMWMTAFKDAGDALMAGDALRAEDLATAALQMGTDSGQPDAFAIYGSQLMYIRHQQGRLGELVPLIEQAVTDNPGLPAFHPILASAHLEAGNDVTALGLLESAAADGFASLPMDFVWMMGINFYASVAVELLATGPAQKLHDLLAPYHRQVPFIGTLGFVPLALALGGLTRVLGRYDEAESYLAEAAEITSRGRMNFSAAHIELERGRMLAARRGPRDLERARTHFEQARSAGATHGYSSIERGAGMALGL